MCRTLQPPILFQGGDDEGDSDDEELPFENSSNNGSCAARRHVSRAAAPCTLELAPIILAIRSSMRLASQNGAKTRNDYAQYHFADCSAPWNVHAQLYSCSVRCGVGSDCSPQNANGKPVAIMGRLALASSLFGLRFCEMRLTCWHGCFLGRAFPAPHTPHRTLMFSPIYSLNSCLTHGRISLRSRKRRLREKIIFSSCRQSPSSVLHKQGATLGGLLLLPEPLATSLG